VTVDTRNVLVSEVIVGVEDVQDTPPQFIAISNFIEIPGSVNKVKSGIGLLSVLS
jgi:hypothetical protein